MLKPVVTHKLLRYVFIVVTVGVAAGLTTQAPKLSYPTTGEIQLFPDSNPLERYCCAGPKAKEVKRRRASTGLQP